MHHFYDLLMYNLARQSDLSAGVQTAYLSLRYEIIHLPILQRMYPKQKLPRVDLEQITISLGSLRLVTMCFI